MSLGNTSIKFIEYMLGLFGYFGLIYNFSYSLVDIFLLIISLFALFSLTLLRRKYPLKINRINIYNVIKISLVYWISINLIFWVALLILGRGFY